MDAFEGAVVEQPRRRVVRVKLDLVDRRDDLVIAMISIRTFPQASFWLDECC